MTIQSLRFWLFVTPGIIAHPGGKTTIKFAVPPRECDWSSRLWEKILASFPTAMQSKIALRLQAKKPTPPS